MKKHKSGYQKAVITCVIALGISVPGSRLFGRESTDKQSSAATTQNLDHSQKAGEQIFMEQCSRCHRPPMSISPRITGTIIMHMRVRAKLSREEEKVLLRYLAP
jgi:cytochrome c5